MSSSKKILIAEDSNIVSSLTKKVLENMKYEVDVVKNGLEILEKLKTSEYQLILMDINMPKMDGIECTQNIRSNSDKSISDIPILAISGNAKNFTIDQYKELGINDLIQKPIDFDSLTKKIIDILG
jgi:CheY-like chemotaxis protein